MAFRLDPRFFNMRRSLVVGAFAIVVTALVTFVACFYAFILAPVERELARAQLAETSKAVEDRLQSMTIRVEAVALATEGWGRTGLVDFSRGGFDPRFFVDLYSSILPHGPSLSSVVLADETGREFLLYHGPRGDWISRETRPESWGKKAKLLHWSSSGDPLGQETENLDYDARTRPWFKTGTEISHDFEVHWTKPYVFKSTGDHGISAVVSWKNRKGLRHYFANDLRMIDFSLFTRSLVAGAHGFVAVIGGEGRIYGLPRSDQVSSEAEINALMLKSPEEIGNPALADGFRAWKSRGSPANQLISFSVKEVPWQAIFKRDHLGDQEIWVATFAPAADFLPASSKYYAAFFAVLAFTILISWYIAGRVAERLVRPLEKLVEISANLGRMELESPIELHSSLPEIQELARAQDSMRRQLRLSTQRLIDSKESLEQVVAQRTRDLEHSELEARSVARLLELAAKERANFLVRLSRDVQAPLQVLSDLSQKGLRGGETEEFYKKISAAAAKISEIMTNFPESAPGKEDPPR
ncbi:MAG: hypothetical protein ACXVB9_02235 [Bdellovibrionota bacterium]